MVGMVVVVVVDIGDGLVVVVVAGTDSSCPYFDPHFDSYFDHYEPYVTCVERYDVPGRCGD